MSEGSLFYRELPIPPEQVVGVAFSVNVAAPVAFEEEDVPLEIWLRGYRYEVGYAIEGDTVSGWDAFEPQIERALDAGAALYIDGTLVTREAGEEIIPPRDRPKVNVASLAPYFEGGPRFEAEGFERVLALMQSDLPEALPNRYGPYAPPQFALAKQGPAHFKAEWRRNPALVWMGAPPISRVFTSIRNDSRDPKSPETRGRPLMGYYCSRIEILVEADLARAGDLTVRLERFLQEASVATRAFYAEMRAEKQDGPGWWWKGLPPTPPLCFALGAPYTSLWSKASLAGEPLGPRQVWISCKAQKRLRLAPPPHLAHPAEDRSPRKPGQQWRYARRFPFARHDEPLMWWWHAIQKRMRDAAD